MSVESGVGVACGCLPGCKPLMNRMFPRLIGTTSHSSSYPRPSAQARAAGKLDPSGSSKDESFHMQPLRSNNQVTVNEKRVDVEAQEVVRPPPARQSRMAFGRGAGKYGELQDGSDGSSDEMIILQRGSVDERSWSRSLGRQKA
jgi:hypothetical protein